MIEIIKEGDFDAKVDVTGPVVVEFFATWCPHCQRMQPIVDELAQEIADKEAVYQVDIDRSPELAREFAPQGVPTFVLFKNGQPEKKLTGEQTIETLRMFAS